MAEDVGPIVQAWDKGEAELARVIAKRVLLRTNADPDDDLAILARQLLRAHEANGES